MNSKGRICIFGSEGGRFALTIAATWRVILTATPSPEAWTNRLLYTYRKYSLYGVHVYLGSDIPTASPTVLLPCVRLGLNWC